MPSELYEFLFADYVPWPERLGFYEQALAEIERVLAGEPVSVSDRSF